jgi:Tfp pilus assembly protein PilF
VLHECGVLSLRNGQEDQGVRLLTQALRKDPKHRPTHKALAEYYESKGDNAAAARHREASRK